MSTCDHRKCIRLGEGCRAFTAEQLTPTEADLELARQLIADGWYSASNKYRTVVRWREQPPPLETWIASDLPEPWRSDTLACLKRSGVRTHGLRSRNAEHVEERTLSVLEFRAFKKLGGPSA